MDISQYVRRGAQLPKMLFFVGGTLLFQPALALAPTGEKCVH